MLKKISLLVINIMFVNFIMNSEEIEINLDKTEVYNKINKLKINNKSKDVIYKDEIIASGANTLSELLKKKLSINISDGLSSSPRIDIRGQGETSNSNVKIIFNNMTMNSFDMSSVRLDSIPINEIEEIEIIRGGSSSFYGDGALGGVINIITNSNEKNNNLKFDTKISNYTDLQGNIDFGFNNEKFYTYGGTSYKNNDGYRENSYSKEKGFRIGLDYIDNENKDKVYTLYNHTKSKYGLSGSLNESEVINDRRQSKTPDDNVDVEWNLFNFGFNKNIKNADLKLDISSQTEDVKADYVSLNSYQNTKKDIFEIKPKMEFNYFENNYFLLGYDYYYGKSKVSNPYYENDYNKKSSGYYFINSIDYKNFNFLQSYRDEEIKYNNLEYNMNAYDLSFSYDYNDIGKIYFDINKSYRTPNVDELSYVSGNEVLQPQENKTFEIGISDYILNNLVNLSVYYTKSEDEIFYDPNDNFGFGANRNIEGKTERKGIDLSIEQTFDKFSISEKVSYVDHKIKDGIYKDNKIPGIPNINAVIGLEYNFNSNTKINSNVNYKGSYYAFSDYNNLSSKEKDSIVVDIFGQHEFSNGIKLGIGINNLFNEKYYDYVGYSTQNSKYYYPAKEREYYLELSYKID